MFHRSSRSGVVNRVVNRCPAVNDALRRTGISGRLYGRGVVHPYFGPVRSDSFDHDYEAPSTDAAVLMGTRFGAVSERLSLHLLQRGVATLHGSMFVFSSVHSGRDVDVTLDALEGSLDAMRAEGSVPSELQVARPPR